MEFLLIVFIVVVLLLVLPLLGFHCGLVLLGRNTHEHVTGKFNSQHPNPFDLGFVSNCMFFSCRPAHPKYIRYKSKSTDTSPYVERYRTISSSESLSVESSRVFEQNSSLQLSPLDTSLGHRSPVASPDHGHNNTYINLKSNAYTKPNNV